MYVLPGRIEAQVGLLEYLKVTLGNNWELYYRGISPDKGFGVAPPSSTIVASRQRGKQRRKRKKERKGRRFSCFEVSAGANLERTGQG